MIFKKKCLYCKKIMSRTSPAEAKRKNWLYCSQSCKGKNQKPINTIKKEIRLCLICHNKYSIYPNNKKHQNRKICSRKCYPKYYSLFIEPNLNRKEINQKLSNTHKNNYHKYKKFIWTNEKREQLRVKNSGANNKMWKGGVTPENKRLRMTSEYTRWRKNVFEKDDYTCQICFVRGGTLQADHIKPFAYFPEIRFELSNGRTLCVNCHKKTDTYMGRATTLYRQRLAK